MNQVDAEHTGRPRLRLRERLLYGVGHFGLSLMGYMVVACVVPFYNPPAAERARGAHALVASATLIAAILFLSRLIDLLADPLVGFLSDRTHTKWGRRKPFMIVSAPLVAISFVLLFRPPLHYPSDVNAWYAGIMLTVVFTLFAGFAAPYLGLLPEVARGTRERVRLAMVQGIFNLLGIAVAAIGVGLLAPRYGFPRTAAAVSALCLLAMWISCLGPGEPCGESEKDATPHLPLRQAVVKTLTNVPFLIYWAGYYLFLVPLMVVLAGMEYLGSAFLHLPRGAAGGISAIALFAGLLCLPLSKWLVVRRGPRFTFLAGMLWMAVFAPLLGLLGLHGMGLGEARVFAALLGPAVAVLFTVPYTILAAICDLDFARTGNHREAIYFGFQGTMMKAGWGIAPLIAALVMQLFGTGAPLKLGYHMLGPIAGVMALLGFLVFLAYPERRLAAEYEALTGAE